MEYLTKILNEAALKIGSKKALADYLDIAPSTLANVLAGERGLTPYAQEKLEELMNLPHGNLRPASEIITEKNPKRRAYWEKKLEALAASIFFGLVILNMSPSPAEARQIAQVVDYQCILC